MDDQRFDKIAEEELRHLERTLGDLDPDEVDVERAADVLTLSFPDGGKVIINSHRAARQIWMAAFRQGWHFSPNERGARVEWRTATEELRSTVARLLTEKLGRKIAV